MLSDNHFILCSKLLRTAWVCSLILVFGAASQAMAQEQEGQSVAEAARAARARHDQATGNATANAATATKHTPFSQSQLVAWTIAGVSAPSLLAEVRANGISFAPDDTHLAALKDAQLSPDLLAALPTVASHPEAGTSETVAPSLIAAAQAFHANDYPAARKLLETLTQQSPNADLFAALGNLCYLAHDMNRAKSSFQRSVQLDPNFVYAHLRLAGVYYALEDATQTATEAQTVLQLQPGNPQARKYLALSKTAGGSASASTANPEYEGDVEDLSDFKGGSSQEAKDLNNQSNEFSRSHNLIAAEAALKKAIELDPDVAVYHYNLGSVYGKWPQFEKALAEYQKAKTLAPRNLAVHQNLGHTLCKLHRWNEAVVEFSDILRMDPDWNMARPCLYDSLYNVGRKSEAAKVLNEYKQFNLTHGLPDDSDEIDAEKRQQPHGVHL